MAKKTEAAPERNLEQEIETVVKQNQILADQVKRWMDRFYGLKMVHGEMSSEQVIQAVQQDLTNLQTALQRPVAEMATQLTATQ